jgi:hypothetical protein
MPCFAMMCRIQSVHCILALTDRGQCQSCQPCDRSYVLAWDTHLTDTLKKLHSHTQVTQPIANQ